MGSFDIKTPWEECTIISSEWSWTGGKHVKGPRTCIRFLVRVVGRGGNLLLDVAPRPDGSIDPKELAALKGMGEWLKKYGETIYATTAGPYKPGLWGVSTRKGNKIYLHVLQRWGNGAPRAFTLPSLPATITKSYMLTGGTVGVTSNENGITIDLSEAENNLTDMIVVLEMDKNIEKVEPLPTMDYEPLKIVEATASSGDTKPITDSNIVLFKAGAHVKGSWKPKGSDKQPWLEVSLEKEETIDAVIIEQNPRWTDGIKQYELQYFDGEVWKTFYKSDQGIGARLALAIKPIKTSKVRLSMTEKPSTASISAFNLFRKK